MNQKTTYIIHVRNTHSNVRFDIHIISTSWDEAVKKATKKFPAPLYKLYI